MAFRYVITNLINEDCTLYSSSEDPVHVLENIYIGQPSQVFRFEGVGSVILPEWICVDLTMVKAVNFCGIFNTNLTYLPTTGGTLTYRNCASGCPTMAGACDWFGGGFTGESQDLTPRMLENSRNVGAFPLFTPRQYHLLEVADPTNPDSYVEIGEWVLGICAEFSAGIHIQPGRPDSPKFPSGMRETAYGQLKETYYGEYQEFELGIKNINDAAAVDELNVFLRAVKLGGGKFIYIPDHNRNFCYYVMVMNQESTREIYGTGDRCAKELRNWRMKLRTLVEGISFVGP